MELMVGTKGLFVVVIVSIALVLVSLVVLILVSDWLQLVIVLMVGLWLPLCFLLFEVSIVFQEVVDIFGHNVWGNVGIAPIQNTFLNGVEHVGIIEVMAMGSCEQR